MEGRVEYVDRLERSGFDQHMYSGFSEVRHPCALAKCSRWVGDTRRFGRHLQAISTHNGGLPSMLTYVPEARMR